MRFSSAIFVAVTAMVVAGLAQAQDLPAWDQRVVFDQSGKPFDEVIKWFAAQAKLKLVSKYQLPTTKITFTDAKNKSGKPGVYSLTTIFDLINARLMAEENLSLVYSGKSLTVVRVGSLLYDVERLVIPRVSEGELKDRPKTDIVEVLIKLPAGLDAEELAPPVKRMLGDFGRVTVMPGNQLILQADVGTLRKILPEIKHAPVSWKNRVVFDQSGKPWPEVLKWFASESNLPLVTLAKLPPKGKFVFVDADNKTGKPREYTLLQIFDTLNRELQTKHKLTILRGDVQLTLAALPVSEIPGENIATVRISDLGERGETELVEVLFTLWSGHDGEEWVDKLKPMLGPHGVITSISNRLIVRADVATIRHLLAVLDAAKKDRAREVDWLTKRYAFEAKDKPWREMIGWLSSEAELPWITRGISPAPRGNFTFVNPRDARGNPRMYSLAEIFYILDGRLREEQELRLVRTDLDIRTWRLNSEIPSGFNVMDPPRPVPTESHLGERYPQPLPRCRPGLLGRLLRR